MNGVARLHQRSCVGHRDSLIVWLILGNLQHAVHQRVPGRINDEPPICRQRRLHIRGSPWRCHLAYNIVWQFPLKMLHFRNPPNRQNQISHDTNLNDILVESESVPNFLGWRWASLYVLCTIEKDCSRQSESRESLCWLSSIDLDYLPLVGGCKGRVRICPIYVGGTLYVSTPPLDILDYLPLEEGLTFLWS